jgi:hypothetical protein
LADRWLEKLFRFAYPLAHWALDEIEGRIAQDNTGQNDAEFFGDPLWQPEGGRVDGALLLDGVDDFLGTEYILDPAAGSFSVFAWVKGGAPGQTIVSQLWGVNWLVADTAEGHLRTELREASHSAKSLVSETAITDGSWHHIGITWDGTNRVLYVDDRAVAADTQASLAQNRGGLNIGCGPDMTPGSFWSGLIDDVRIFDRAVRP